MSLRILLGFLLPAVIATPAFSQIGMPIGSPNEGARVHHLDDDQKTTVTFVKVQGASPGHYATVTVETTPNAKCSIVYTTPSGRTSTAAGLDDETSDGKGEASWTWLIGGRTNPGTGTITVTCNGVSATSDISIP